MLLALNKPGFLSSVIARKCDNTHPKTPSNQIPSVEAASFRDAAMPVAVVAWCRLRKALRRACGQAPGACRGHHEIEERKDWGSRETEGGSSGTKHRARHDR
jgi:hypothetical protein